MALDGGLAVDLDSQALLATSLSSAIIKADESGSFRLVKKWNKQHRDVTIAPLRFCWLRVLLPESLRPATVRSLGLA